MRYSAFISYNHRDRDWAIWLHRKMEAFRIPKRLQGRQSPWGVLGDRLPPVFRDRDELATSSDLGAAVQTALAESAMLVVVCSPNSAKSRWVDQEVRTFIEDGRANMIRLIIVDGEPHSTDPERECLPPALLDGGAPEPLAADVRATADGRQGALLKVIAGMIGVPFDELRQREAARRQKRLLIVATAATIGFVAMSGLSIFALFSRAEAVRQRTVAEHRTATAERTLDFVKSMFEVADPSEARGQSITAREIVDRAATRLDDSLQSEPAVKAELGTTLAEVYGALGLFRQADTLVRRSLGVPHDQPSTRARQLAALGESQFRLADYQGSSNSFRQAWRHAGEASPALKSRILVGLGQSLSAVDAFVQADRLFRHALRLDRRREGAERDVARDLEMIGNNLFYAGDSDKAEPLIVKALAMRRRLEGNASPSVSDNLNTLGQIAYGRGDLNTAERYFRGNLAVDEKVLGPSHPDTGTTLNNLARVSLEQRRFEQAEGFAARAVAIAVAERGAEHDDMAFLFANLALAKRHLGKTGDAEHLFDQSIAAARKHRHRILGPALADLAEVLCARGQSATAMALLAEAATVVRSDYPDDPWRTAWVENIRGACLLRDGQAEPGRRLLKSSYGPIRKRWPDGTLFAVEADRRMRRAGLPLA